MKLSIVDTNVTWRRRFFIDAALRRAREEQRAAPAVVAQPPCTCGDCVPCEFRRARARRQVRR